MAFKRSDSTALSASSFFRAAFSDWVALRRSSMWASLMERLPMVVLEVGKCSRMASTLAAMVLTLAVSASSELVVSVVSVGLALGGILADRELL